MFCTVLRIFMSLPSLFPGFDNRSYLTVLRWMYIYIFLFWFGFWFFSTCQIYSIFFNFYIDANILFRSGLKRSESGIESNRRTTIVKPAKLRRISSRCVNFAICRIRRALKNVEEHLLVPFSRIPLSLFKKEERKNSNLIEKSQTHASLVIASAPSYLRSRSIPVPIDRKAKYYTR